MNVSEFCHEHTQVGELVVIRDDGYIVAAVWIDHEDLFSTHINPGIATQQIKKDSWGKLNVTTEHGNHVLMPCHYIDI
jgi:hypothetical protein